MARNHKFFLDRDGSPRARGPSSEALFMSFLETDVQGSDHVCRDLMDDVTAIEDGSDDARDFVGNAHSVSITRDGVSITCVANGEPGPGDEKSPSVGAASAPDEALPPRYRTGLQHFREVLEDWEAFIMEDRLEMGGPDIDDDLNA